MLPLCLSSLFANLVLASAFSFDFTSTPQQCQNLSLAISGSGGTSPYTVLIVPYGASPLENGNEIRTIFEVEFSDTPTSFELKYPTDSQFVAMVSDSTGFGTGGTSVVATVLSSDGSSCYDSSQQVSPDFSFSLLPDGLTQCATTRLWWDSSLAEGTPSFKGIIPGGESFSVPESTISNVSSEGTGTTIVLVAGDDRGTGTGGSGEYVVEQGGTEASSCLNSGSPSSTPGSPEGGSYPTNTDGASVGSSSAGSTVTATNTNATAAGSGSSSHTDVGATVGGVVCGLLALHALILLLLHRRYRKKRAARGPKERPVSLLNEDSNDSGGGGLPRYYEPTPFVLPEPSARDRSTAQRNGSTVPPTAWATGLKAEERRSGETSTGEGDASGRPSRVSGETVSTKNPLQSLRPVNIVQHEDAGPQADEHQEPDTIELPHAYATLRRGPTPPSPPESAATAA